MKLIWKHSAYTLAADSRFLSILAMQYNSTRLSLGFGSHHVNYQVTFLTVFLTLWGLIHTKYILVWTNQNYIRRILNIICWKTCVSGHGQTSIFYLNYFTMISPSVQCSICKFICKWSTDMIGFHKRFKPC